MRARVARTPFTHSWSNDRPAGTRASQMPSARAVNGGSSTPPSNTASPPGAPVKWMPPSAGPNVTGSVMR